MNSAIPSTPYYHAMMVTLLKEPFQRLSGGHDVSFSCRIEHRNIRASDISMSKDRLDDSRRATGLEQMHSFRMTHSMRADIFR